MDHELIHPRPGSVYDKTTEINVSNPGRIISSAAGASLLYLACANFSKSPMKSIYRAIAGGYLLYRGLSGNCPVSAMVEDKLARPKHARAINIRTKFHVARPRNEVYAYWRQLDHLPAFMAHLHDVEVVDETHSHWTVKLAGDITLEWDAEIVEEQENELLGWRSMEGATISNAGKVTFRDAPGGGTELQVMITYRPPAGYAGAGIARLLNPAFARLVKNDVRNFKNYVEARSKKKGSVL